MSINHSISYYEAHLSKIESMLKKLNSRNMVASQKAGAQLMELFSRYPKYISQRLYSTYGAMEMKYIGIEMEDLINQAFLEIYFAAKKFRFNKDGRNWDAEHEFKAFYSYIYTSVSGNLKHWIENQNDYSHYYSCYLLRIKKSGLDLYKSDDEDLIKVIQFKDPSREVRNPEYLLKKLRAMFSDKKINYTECIKEIEGSFNKEMETARYESLISQLRDKLTYLESEILMDYFINENVTSIKDVADKYRLSIRNVNIIIQKIRKVAAGFLDLEGDAIDNRLYNHNHLSNLRRMEGRNVIQMNEYELIDDDELAHDMVSDSHGYDDCEEEYISMFGDE